jgi:hypothetical protein
MVKYYLLALSYLMAVSDRGTLTVPYLMAVSHRGTLTVGFNFILLPGCIESNVI